jgi:hypothetical protein
MNVGGRAPRSPLMGVVAGVNGSQEHRHCHAGAQPPE